MLSTSIYCRWVYFYFINNYLLNEVKNLFSKCEQSFFLHNTAGEYIFAIFFFFFIARNLFWKLRKHKTKRSKTATQSAITCSKITIETLEHVVKYVQS